MLNANNYGIAQDRKRVFYVGFGQDLKAKFNIPKPYKNKLVLKDIIFDLQSSAIAALKKIKQMEKMHNTKP